MNEAGVHCIAVSGIKKVPGLLSHHFIRIKSRATQDPSPSGFRRSGSILVLRTPIGGEEWEGVARVITSKGSALTGLQGLPWVWEVCEGMLEERLRLTEGDSRRWAPEFTPCGKEEEVYSGVA